MAQGIGLVDLDTVDDLAAVLGDCMEEIVDNTGIRTVLLKFEGDAVDEDRS